MFHQRSGRLILSRNMETKTTTINGKQVTLCYCYGTEINFSKLTNGENINVFIPETAKKIDALSKGDATAMPDVEKCICLVLAAAIAYYKSKGISLLEQLDDIWNKYGYCLNTLHSYEFEVQLKFFLVIF